METRVEHVGIIVSPVMQIYKDCGTAPHFGDIVFATSHPGTFWMLDERDIPQLEQQCLECPYMAIVSTEDFYQVSGDTCTAGTSDF